MRIFAFFGIALILIGCGGGGGGSTDKPMTKADLGERLFHDKNLSLTRNQSCATCHNPDRGFIDDRDNAVSGAVSLGDDGVSLGSRNAPTASYAAFAPVFGLNTVLNRYEGGQFLDGRASTLKDQAKGPPLNPSEMMMPDKASVADRLLENKSYARDFKALFGEAIFSDVNATYDAMAEAIAEFEKTDEFAPFDSRYDRFLECRAAGKSTNTCYAEGQWTNEEQTGHALFFGENNTNCWRCHTLTSGNGEFEGNTFTNYEYHNIGVPKNPDLVHLGGGFVDHGLKEHIDNASNDGRFKVPTLRNVAVTGPYMHNGVFKDLRTAVMFYDKHLSGGTHLINPETNAAWADAEVEATVNDSELKMGQVLSDSKIDALTAFLKTLTDKRYEPLLED